MSDKIVSPSQHYELDIQDDGNLVIYRRDGSVVWSVGVDPTPLPPPTPPPMPTLTPLQVREGRLRNEAGWLHWRGLSEFSAVHLVRTGQEVELVRRLDRARAAGRNGIRVLMMAHNLFDLAPSMVGYWSAANVVVQLAQARGLYVEAVGFADAQTVMPDAGSRRGFTLAFADWCRQHPTVLPQLANEAAFNGWTGATDPALLALAQLFSTNYGRAFSISDPQDVVDDPATGNPLRADLEVLGAQSAVLVLHGDRSSSGQWARWVDHLKGFEEVYDNPNGGYRIHDEPMGAAGVMQPGRRDNRPEAHLAAALACAVMGIGFTYHYVSEQDDGTPGLDLCAAQALVPASPDFHFKNAGTGGACVTRFSGGFDKVRTCDNGREAWAVGYGQTLGTAEWATGWQAQTVLQQESHTGAVVLWKATR